MRKVLCLLAMLVAGVNILFAQLAGTKTIGSSGNYTTIEAAITALNTSGTTAPGVTFLIASGTYTAASGAYYITTTTGRAAAPIEFRPAAGATVVINVSSNGGAAWRIGEGAGYITINGSNTGTGTDRSMTINNTYAGVGVGVKAFGTNVNCAFKNLVVTTGASSATSKVDPESRGIDVNSGGSDESSNFLVDNCSVNNAGVGIKVQGNSNMSLLSGVVIRNNTITNTGLYGIHSSYCLGPQIYNNDVQTPNGTGSSVWGIAVATATSGNFKVFNNKVHNVKSTTTGSTNSSNSVAGIYLNSTFGFNSRSGNIYNNFVYDVNATASSGTVAVYGIHCVNTSPNNAPDSVVHNSVSLTGTYTANRVSAALAFNSVTAGQKLYVQNNIFSNTLTNGTAAAMSILKSTAASTLFSDNNDLYVGTTSASRLTGRIATTDYQTLANWQILAGQDGAGIAVNAPFTSATDLHIPSGTASALESNGAPVSFTGINRDIDGQVRPGPSGSTNGGGTSPDIGADEFNGVPVDVFGPVITYTPISNICTTVNVTLSNVTITDNSGVPITGSLVPRIYYRKSFNGTYFSSAGTLSSGSATNGQWSFTINVADLGGVALGDSVYYYLVAQDITTPVNISSNAPGVIASSVNAVTVHPANVDGFAIGSPIGGVYTVGAGGNFATLSAAALAYNTGCLTGAVTFSLLDALYAESISINSNRFSSSTNFLLIKPAAGVTTQITASSPTAVIKLNGADYVTIDGSNTVNGTSRNLTISNTNTSVTSAVLWNGSTDAGYGDGATNNTFRNLVIQGQGSTSTFVGILSGSGVIIGYPANAPNNNLQIMNNLVQRSQYGVAITGIGTQTGNKVTGNTIGGADPVNYIGFTGLFAATCDGMQISNNKIYNIITSSANPIGMNIADNVINSTISGNSITSIRYIGTSDYGAKGMNINTGTANSNLNVYNNTIADIGGDGWNDLDGSAIVGVRIGATGGSSIITGGINFYHNTVSLGSGAFSGSTAATISAALYLSNTTSNINLKDNILYSNLVNLNASTAKTYAIYSDAGNAAFTDIDYNNYAVDGSQGVLGYIGSARADLAGIQAGFGSNANSVNIAPVFNSVTDLHLAPATNMGLDNKGTPIGGITTDIDGETRNASTPDMGADEFNSNVLPVTLLEFRGEKAGKFNKLSWATANEQNNAGFELQRSANGTSFSTIGQVASRAVNGSSAAPLQYGFDDVQPLNGANYYRLKQLDKDGRFTYSATVLLKGEKVTSVQLGVVYPNPITSVLQFSVATPASRKVSFVITDLSGRTVLSSLQQLSEGNNTIQLSVGRLSAGTYLLKAVCTEGCETTTARFIKL